MRAIGSLFKAEKLIEIKTWSDGDLRLSLKNIRGIKLTFEKLVIETHKTLYSLLELNRGLRLVVH